MRHILRLDASVRHNDATQPQHRSISKQLGDLFIDTFIATRLSTTIENDVAKINTAETPITYRDLSQHPPHFIDAEWLAAVFSKPSARSEAQSALLAESDQYIAEVEKADVILITTPMYNYGMPAVLKAWFDQVIRIHKTFSFDLERGDFPLEPIFSNKTLVLLSSTGEFGFEPSGIREHMDHLGTHIKVLSHYLGAQYFYEIRCEYQEFADQRHQDSLENAKQHTIALAKCLSNSAQ